MWLHIQPGQWSLVVVLLKQAGSLNRVKDWMLGGGFLLMHGDYLPCVKVHLMHADEFH